MTTKDISRALVHQSQRLGRMRNRRETSDDRCSSVPGGSTTQPCAQQLAAPHSRCLSDCSSPRGRHQDWAPAEVSRMCWLVLVVPHIASVPEPSSCRLTCQRTWRREGPQAPSPFLSGPGAFSPQSLPLPSLVSRQWSYLVPWKVTLKL